MAKIWEPISRLRENNRKTPTTECLQFYRRTIRTANDLPPNFSKSLAKQSAAAGPDAVSLKVVRAGLLTDDARGLCAEKLKILLVQYYESLLADFQIFSVAYSMPFFSQFSM